MVKLPPGREMSASCYLVFFLNHILLGQVKPDYLESKGMNHGRCALIKTYVRPLSTQAHVTDPDPSGAVCSVSCAGCAASASGLAPQSTLCDSPSWHSVP